MREDIEPTVEQQNKHGFRNVARHPAFGVISASRINGSKNLFGSNVGHSGFIRITIRRAEMIDYEGIHSHLMGNEYIAEVDLSEAQWVALVSRMNHGEGTPCTITMTETNYHVPQIKHVPKAEELLHKKAEELGAIVGRRADERAERLRKLITERVPKKEQQKALIDLDLVLSDSTASGEFFKKVLRETAEKLTTEARIEIDAMLNGAITNLGLESAQQLGAILAADPKKAILLIADQNKKDEP